ncbi:MAG TPA: gluconokinase [Candidatus Limnocylindrales bacterium]|nr:gluconokinase [Candidatus Limnocylindrales bacterium]
MSSACLHVIVMGVSGSGKSVVGKRLAALLGVEFIEGDDHHPAENIEKMAAGSPLTDEDRAPWLRALAEIIAERHEDGVGTVLACSALRRAYRDLLRAAIPMEESFVIHLDADVETLRSRLASRRGHYMPVSLLDSQLTTLEPLEPDEAGVFVDAARPLDVVVASALAGTRDRASR